MANILAAANGNWSATGTWVGGVVPTGGDNAYSNGKTITIDVNAAAAKVSTVAENGSSGGGGFTLSNGFTLTAYCDGGTSTCITLDGANSAAIVGNVNGGTGTNCYGAYNNSTGTITITGNVKGGTGANCPGTYNNSTGTITITGNVTGGTSANCPGAYNHSTGTITITGNATGGTGTNCYGAHNNSLGTIYLKRAVGNDCGPGGVSLYSNYGAYNNLASAPFYIEEIEYGANGQTPTLGVFFLTPASTNRAILTRYDRTKKTLVDPDVAGYDYPDESDVRKDIAYATGRIGTCAVPIPGNVDLGIAVDDTVGTAYLTEAAITTALAGLLGPTVVAAVADGFAASTISADVAAIEARMAAQVLTGPVLVVPAPASSGETIAWCRCWDEHGDAEEGVLIEVQLVSVPKGTGDAYDTAIASASSNADGLASVSIARGDGFKYLTRRNGGQWKAFTGVDADSIELPDLMGP